MTLLAAPSRAQDKSQPIASIPRAAPHAMSSPNPGGVVDGVYRNPSFGFSYKLPYGWVDRTADMQDDTASQSRVLMAIFERPPQASGDTINSAVIIAAEPLPAGTKTAAEYFESLSALTTAKGFQTKEEPREFSLGATRLVRVNAMRFPSALRVNSALKPFLITKRGGASAIASAATSTA